MEFERRNGDQWLIKIVIFSTIRFVVRSELGRGLNSFFHCRLALTSASILIKISHNFYSKRFKKSFRFCNQCFKIVHEIPTVLKSELYIDISGTSRSHSMKKDTDNLGFLHRSIILLKNSFLKMYFL